MIRDYYAHVRFRRLAEENFARAINSAGGITRKVLSRYISFPCPAQIKRRRLFYPKITSFTMLSSISCLPLSGLTSPLRESA